MLAVVGFVARISLVLFPRSLHLLGKGLDHSGYLLFIKIAFHVELAQEEGSTMK